MKGEMPLYVIRNREFMKRISDRLAPYGITVYNVEMGRAHHQLVWIVSFVREDKVADSSTFYFACDDAYSDRVVNIIVRGLVKTQKERQGK